MVKTASAAHPLTADAPGDQPGPRQADPAPAEYRLQLHRAHTDEHLEVVYRRGARYVPQAIRQLNHFLRDYRTGENGRYDVREFDLLHELMHRLDLDNGVVEVLCGYRSPTTNAYLRARLPLRGAAKHSLHMQSKAVDIRVPEVSLEKLRDVALSLKMGGVGYYPQSNFVHVDVGPLRSWTFGAEQVRMAHTRHSIDDGQGFSGRGSPQAGGS